MCSVMVNYTVRSLILFLFTACLIFGFRGFNKTVKKNMNKSTKDYFDVAVKVFECSNLSIQSKHLSIQVCIQVGKEKRYSKVVHHVNTSIFGDYFVFTKFKSFSEFMDTLITISLLRVRKGFRIRTLIGSISMDVATLWSQPERQLRRFFALAVPSDRSMQKRAFIECDLKIMTTFEYFELFQFLNVASSEMIGSKRARYKVLIYHCVGLRAQEGRKAEEASIKIFFAEKSRSTSKRKIGDLVVWNEQISFVELFPPMRQKLTVKVLSGKKVLATITFNLFDFFKIFHGGFFDMLGPAYVHLYAENNLYRGSLLMSLESEILGQLREFEHVNPVSLLEIEPVSSVKYGTNKKFIFFGIIFELMIINSKCGKDDIYLSSEIGNDKSLMSKRYSAISSDGSLHVPFKTDKNCISLECEWPDCIHRLYNSNLLASVTDDLREKLNYSYVLTSRGCHDDANDLLQSAFEDLKKESMNVIELLSTGITELDSKRTAFLKSNINMLATVLTTDIDVHTITKLCKFLLGVLDSCTEDIQGSIPQLLITLHQGGKRLGSCSLHPRHIIFSSVEEERGRMSARVSDILLKGDDGDIVARINVWFWLGRREQVDSCKLSFPPGFKPFALSKESDEQIPLPSTLTYPTNHSYIAICHVHCGNIDGEAVDDGECDSFVRVCFANQTRRTSTAKRTLAPTWKETIIFPDIKLCLSPNYLVENPPSFMVQLCREINKMPNLIDCTLISANVRLQPLTKVPEFSLRWWNVGHNCEVLLACEIHKISFGSDSSTQKHISLIHKYLEPPTVSYRLEVVFWGMRPTYARALKDLVQPQISIQVNSARLSSDVIARANKTFNFKQDTRIINLTLPVNRVYSPPLTIKVMSNFQFLASISEKDLYRYEYDLPTRSRWNAFHSRRTTDRGVRPITGGSSHRVAMPDLIPQTEVEDGRTSSVLNVLRLPSRIRSYMGDYFVLKGPKRHQNGSNESSIVDDEMEQDWWDRYWMGQMKIYHNTLENQDTFSGFTDVLSTFTVKPKNFGNEPEISKLKAIIRLYKWPVDVPVVTMQGQDPEVGVLKLSEIRNNVNLLVRVYCIKATDLYPSNLNGKSDPYIELATQTKTVSDKANKILGELNPVFGKHLDIVATLPLDSPLSVRVMDWDLLSSDDVIGETIIDIENRFYSKHRATCGLPETYSTEGPNAWRDIESPTKILERLCNSHNLPLPLYQDKSVTVGTNVFTINKAISDRMENQQRLALLALNRWKEMPIVGKALVAEHVETRPLYLEGRPGLVRGKLTMWVDLFDMSLGSIPPPRDISPRKPEEFVLRVNILSTKKIPLVDETTIGDHKCVDIRVSGWLGDPESVQNTDVHYKSVTGKGYFNWRFVFPFSYIRKEKKIVYYTKNFLDIGKAEHKSHPLLHLEVYDSEVLMEDMLIGGMILELTRMPRGAHSVKACKLDKVFHPSNYVNLFKEGTLKGWWPFLADSSIRQDRGFLQAEFSLMTAEEARKHPAGRGRSPPDALPAPARARGRRHLWHVVHDMVAKRNCQRCFRFIINTVIILSLIALTGALIYVLPSTIEKLKPWFDDNF